MQNIHIIYCKSWKFLKILLEHLGEAFLEKEFETVRKKEFFGRFGVLFPGSLCQKPVAINQSKSLH